MAVIHAPSGLEGGTFFGMNRLIDASQFKPRGHYFNSPALERYFRTMMWLGRVDVRMVEVDESGSHLLNRHGVRAVLALNALFDAEASTIWARMEILLCSLVGPQDFLDPGRLGALAQALAPDADRLGALSDAELMTVLNDTAFNVQRIRGQFMQGRPGEPAPLPISATLFGQRYVIDSHVLANVVWSAVQRDGFERRMMPDPLDAAFAVFGNDQAASLLADELETYGYAPELAAMRALVDDRPQAEWQGDLHSGWLHALRTLSPNHAIAADPAAHGRPSVWGTEAWGRRMLNTQLGSWAELRHDNLLYSKPSYTGVEGCDYPDGYVEPVPAFYAALAKVATNGITASESALTDVDLELAQTISAWWRNLHDVATTLHALAEQQITGEPFDAEQIRWLEGAVDIRIDDYKVHTLNGWYGELLMLGQHVDPYESDLLVADIHTQPSDQFGDLVGKVLHMGTGDVRLMVMTAESCTGPRAYVGPVYATHQITTQNFERLDDRAWNELFWRQRPDELPWMVDLVVR
jgi:hypothetical protein